MEDSHLTVRETVSASRKLGASEARAMLGSATTLIVAKGKQTQVFELDAAHLDDAVAAMLGPTGNLRAPTIRFGTTLVVGFNASAYSTLLS